VRNIAGVIKQVAAEGSCAARITLRHGHQILSRTRHAEIFSLPYGGERVIEMRDAPCGIGASKLAHDDFVSIAHGIGDIHRSIPASDHIENVPPRSVFELAPSHGACSSR
jgi:hypothetical protein